MVGTKLGTNSLVIGLGNCPGVCHPGAIWMHLPEPNSEKIKKDWVAGSKCSDECNRLVMSTTEVRFDQSRALNATY